MRSSWVPPAPLSPLLVQGLAREIPLPTPCIELLLRRGYSDPSSARAFLTPSLGALHDPFLMAGMERAVERVRRARDLGERVVVHGDYDVDGLTATALLLMTLRRLGVQAEPYLPRRLEEGYGLSPRGVEAAERAGARVLITADCGVTASGPIAEAQGQGIDVIVTDHHEPLGCIPSAFALLDPRWGGSGYPDPDLAGVGVAFKLCQALQTLRGPEAEEEFEGLDLVALGSVADVAPLVGENRILVRYGLERLSRTDRPGLRALLRVAGLEGRPLTYGLVAFALAPRLNAAGRLGAADRALRLLLAAEEREAAALAEELDEENRERQRIERAVAEEARALLAQALDEERDRVIVLARRGWHPGVLGIVASRLVEEWHRPAILIGIDGDGGGRGSGRSIAAFPLHEALARCAPLLESFGGHRHAAGLRIAEERIPSFRDTLGAIAREWLAPEDLRPVVRYDLDLPLSGASEELLHGLRAFEPFGPGNPEPRLLLRDLMVQGTPQVLRGEHLRLRLVQDGAARQAIAFGGADFLGEVTRAQGRLDVVARLREDTWEGRRSLQLQIDELRPAGQGP